MRTPVGSPGPGRSRRAPFRFRSGAAGRARRRGSAAAGPGRAFPGRRGRRQVSAGPRPRVPSPQRGDPRVAPGGARGPRRGEHPPVSASASPQGPREPGRLGEPEPGAAPRGRRLLGGHHAGRCSAGPGAACRAGGCRGRPGLVRCGGRGAGRAMQPAIVITEQPVSVSVPVGYSFTLRCRAEARTSLQYQWFCQRQSVCLQIPGATKQDLPITAQQTQLYTCRVNDRYRNAVFSDWVKVEVHPCVARGLLPQLWQGEPVIILNPTEQKVEVGKPLLLQCAAMGVPAPSYQWYCNGNVLEHQKKKKLWIPHAKVSDSGTYLCCASNSHGEHWTNAVDIHIGSCHSEKFFATGKIALLVGNNRYQHHPNLMAPVTDVFELSVLLKQLGFQVVSLLDLNKAEMVTAVSRFLQLLGKGVYAIFYYAGHGYEHLGRNYMVPIDAPQPYAPENCISVQRILQKMQQQQTALNLILLDTCRKWYNLECALSQVQPLEPWGNIVYGYATCEDAEAYELQDGEFSSGIFMKYLKKHILQEKKVTHMLEDVLEDIGRDPLVTGKQVMEIKHTLKEARSLTDPICPLGAAVERWGCGHEPPRETVTFPCGAQAELRFQHLFSNVMSVCAKLQEPPAHITDAHLMLRQPTEVDDVANLEESRPDQVESLLASVCKQEEQDCIFQLCGLQKIQVDVVLQLDLHYTQLSTKKRTCESLQKILPKSLLGQFFSQRNYAQPKYQNTPAWADPKGQQASLRTGAGHSLPSSNPSNSSSEPEENDESSLSELCSALLRAGPRAGTNP